MCGTFFCLVESLLTELAASSRCVLLSELAVSSQCVELVLFAE